MYALLEQHTLRQLTDAMEQKYPDANRGMAHNALLYYADSRVIERGNDEEYEELFRFYGKERVVHVLTNEAIYLPDYAFERVGKYFSIKKEDMFCYRRKQSRWDIGSDI